MSPLLPRMVAIAVLAVAFVVMTMAIAAGLLTHIDHEVGLAMHDLWSETLHPVFQGIAELGGFEVTTALMVGLFIYLWRGGFGADALVVGVFFGAVALEVLYKFLFYHPGPSHDLSHPDGPSLTDLLPGSGQGNSFPSGHMVRAVVAYGLIAFVVRRLSSSAAIRVLAPAVATVIVALVAFDRLYLDVHWASDVLGALLLGGIALLAGTVWLDRPRKAEG